MPPRRRLPQRAWCRDGHGHGRGEMTTADGRGSQSAHRLLELLFCFTEAHPLRTVPELIEATQLPQSTTYRYLALLRQDGLIEDTGASSLRLTARVVALARAAQAGAAPLHEAAEPILDEVTEATGETALLIRRSGDSAVCAARTLSPHPVRLSYEPGEARSLHRGSAARLLFAWLSPDEREQYRSRVTARYGPEEAARIPDEAAVDELRSLGWTDSFEEVEAGIWGTAAIVSVDEHAIGTLGVAGPLYRLDASSRERIQDIVRQAAERLADRVRPFATQG